MTRPPRLLSRAPIYVLVTASGLAALSWEVLWQLRAGLALGVSAWGAALTLAITMGGMGAGALLAGRVLRKRAATRPVRLYGVLEWVIGGSGLLLGPAFSLAEKLDTWSSAGSPGSATGVTAGAPLVYMLCIAAALGLPALCMGATLPVLGLVARQFGATLPLLYGLNTLGAASGVLLAAFFLIPALGVEHTGWLAAGVNGAVGLSAFLLGRGASSAEMKAAEAKHHETLHRTPKPGTLLAPREAYLVVASTGFATFALETAWFRSLTAAFTSTTAAFAVMLAAVLVSLGVAAALVGELKKRKLAPGPLAACAGIGILLATPLLERFDLIDSLYRGEPLTLDLNRFMMTLYVVGVPVALLGLALPWLLEEQDNPRAWGRLYALNTLAAIGGALGGAWLLLPAIGFARTAWLAGVLAAAAGIHAAPKKHRRVLVIGAVAALAAAMLFDAGAGTARVPGHLVHGHRTPDKILEYREGPEAAVSAVEYPDGGRALVIDGFVTAAQFGLHGKANDHYMSWMGSLPMVLHPHPENALVICFGTGQTANAVRKENPASLDIVDINPRVFQLAHYFEVNQHVLEDRRVRPIAMDGRAWLRRTDKQYDIITLEPMPPSFAGVNALYSREFYALAARRLTNQGIIAQWVPFHLLSSHYMASIVATFQQVFPNAILWLDPTSLTGILLGTKDESRDLGTAWPGFARNALPREFPEETVKAAIYLDRKGVTLYGAKGELITDDNQLLAYGGAVGIPPEPALHETYVALKDVHDKTSSPAAEEAQKKLKLWLKLP